MSVEEKTKIAREYAAGETSSTLAKRYNLSQVFVCRCVKQFGDGIRIKADRAAGKLTSKQKMSLFADYASGMTTYQVANKYGIKACSAWELLKRRGLTRSVSETKRVYALNHDAFAVPSQQRNYWVGFLLTDGCLSASKDNNPSGNSLIVSLAKKDSGHLSKLLEFMGSTHPIRFFTPKRSFAAVPGPMSGISIRIGHMADDLIRLGIVPAKTNVAVAVPSLDMDRDFWRGCMDGDGTVSFHHSTVPFMQLVSGSKRLIEQYAVFCKHVAPGGTWRISFGKGVWVCRATGKYAQQVVAHLYDGCAVALDRKLPAANRMVEIESSQSLLFNVSA